jgi:hypothetical protein
MADRLDESMVLLKGEEGDFGKIADIQTYTLNEETFKYGYII